MKVVVIGPVYPYRGGIAHFTTSLVEELQSSGHDVEIVSYQRQYPKWLYPGESDLDPSMKAKKIAAKFILDPLYPWTWFEAVKAIDEYQPDIILIQWWTTFWSLALSILARRLKRGKHRVIYMIHNVVPHEAKVWDRWAAKTALSPAEGFIVFSSSQKNRLAMLIPRARILQSFLPGSDNFIQNKKPKGEARQILGLAEEIRVVLYFGIVRPYKGLGYLIEAFKILCKRRSDLMLIIVGEFWEPVIDYQDRIRAYGLDDRVRIINQYLPDEQVAHYFSASDCFVAPYIGGTQSAAVKVAQSFGLPVVVTEIVAEGIADRYSKARVVPPADAAALADGIEAALDLPANNPAEISAFSETKEQWTDLVKIVEKLSAT